MDLTPEQIEDFEHKIIQLSEFANSIGLKITDIEARRKNSPIIRATSPEEIKISGVRNLDKEIQAGHEYECKITYLQN